MTTQVATVKGLLQNPEHFSIKWKIKRFFADCEKVGDYYKSPLFLTQYAGKITKWFLAVFPKGEREESKEYVSLYLGFDSANKTEVTVDFQCSIVNEHNSVLSLKRKGTQIFKHSPSNWGWVEFMKQNDIVYIVSTTDDALLFDDTLTILCELTFHPTSQDDVQHFLGYDEWLDKIANGFGDYEKLLDNARFADVTFNVQDKKINLHKAILSCRSPVLEAMFEHDMKEKTQNTVDITDVDYAVMMELLRFIYTGKVKDIEKIAGDLLIAADKYQVTALKALCEKTLYDELTVDNAAEYLKLADMCDTIYLKKLVIKFAASHCRDVFKKPGHC